MVAFKDQWNFPMAIEVISNEQVDSRTWAEAAKWLLLYGPPEIREIISQASSLATGEFFPGLKAAGFDAEGNPVYSVDDLADALGIPREDAMEQLQEIEQEFSTVEHFDQWEVKKIQ